MTATGWVFSYMPKAGEITRLLVRDVSRNGNVFDGEFLRLKHGQMISRCRILAKLGEGGMGVV